MASPTPRAQTSASEVALGLVIEQPATSSGVAQRLNEYLGSTQFAVQAVSKALRRLEEQGFVRSADGVYVATPRGTEHFRDWLSASLPLIARALSTEPKLVLADEPTGKTPRNTPDRKTTATASTTIGLATTARPPPASSPRPTRPRSQRPRRLPLHSRRFDQCQRPLRYQHQTTFAHTPRGRRRRRGKRRQ